MKQKVVIETDRKMDREELSFFLSTLSKHVRLGQGPVTDLVLKDPQSQKVIGTMTISYKGKLDEVLKSMGA